MSPVTFWAPLGGPRGSVGRGQKGPTTQKVLSECLGAWGSLGVILGVWGGPWVRPRE